jgi:hypothetical protein
MEKAVTSPNKNRYPNFKEFLWFESNEQELLRRYFGRYIVIKDEQVIGDYGSRKVARHETLKQHKPGTFIIHLCEEKDPRRTPRLIGHQFISVNATK